MLDFRLVVQPAFCRAGLDNSLRLWLAYRPSPLLECRCCIQQCFDSPQTLTTIDSENPVEIDIFQSLLVPAWVGLCSQKQSVCALLLSTCQRRWFTGGLAKSHVMLLCESR